MIVMFVGGRTAAVCLFTATIGGTTVKAVVKEKKEAKAAFEAFTCYVPFATLTFSLSRKPRASSKLLRFSRKTRTMCLSLNWATWTRIKRARSRLSTFLK
jgi:hypothetical protein